MKRLTQEQIKYVKSIATNYNAFAVLIAWLESGRSEVLETLAVTTDSVAIHRLQGQAQVLKEVVEYLDSAVKKTDF